MPNPQDETLAAVRALEAKVDALALAVAELLRLLSDTQAAVLNLYPPTEG